MTQPEIEAIKNTMRTQGWPLIEQLLLDEADEAKKIKTEGRNYQDIAVEAIANEKMSKAVKSLFRKLNIINSGKTEKPIVYK